MFRASLCPSSGAYKLQQQPLVYHRNVALAVQLVVVGPAGPTTNSTATTTFLGKPEAAAEIYRLLMMGKRKLETC
jgi:hypothetical protein